MPPSFPADDSRLALPASWQPGLDALRALPDGGVALLLGATDRGKTTFAALAAQTLAGELGPRGVAVVDADIGQSEVGPPGTVGVAWADADVARLHELKPVARFFVGAFAPTGVALEHTVATGQAVAWARANGARRILVDTTGFVAGPAARRLKLAKAQLTRPQLLLALAAEGTGELDGLLALLSAATGARVVVLPVPEAVGRKSTTLRATRRMTRLSKAFDGARELVLPLADIATVGATLGTGVPVAPHLARWAGTALRLPVVYAEVGNNALALFVNGAARAGWDSGVAPVAEHFGVRTVRALSLASHAGLLVGLHGEGGPLLSVGRLASLDVERSALLVAAPPPATEERVRLVAFGRVRVGPDGSGGVEVKPGEI